LKAAGSLALLGLIYSIVTHTVARHGRGSLDAFLAHGSTRQALFTRQDVLVGDPRPHAAALIAFACLNFLLCSIVLNTYSGDFVVEFPAFGQVSMLVVVGLILEVHTIRLSHGLPSSAALLHDLERAHIRVSIDNLWSRFFDKNHVRRQALLGLLDCCALAFKLLELTFIPFLVYILRRQIRLRDRIYRLIGSLVD